jgi:uncharacterized membrane protein YccF (DUF307 family)
MSTQSAGTTKTPGRIFSIIGIPFAVVALVLLPIIFGPVGAVLGFVGYSKGDKTLGLWVGIGSIVTTIIGMILGAIVYSSMN